MDIHPSTYNVTAYTADPTDEIEFDVDDIEIEPDLTIPESTLIKFDLGKWSDNMVASVVPIDRQTGLWENMALRIKVNPDVSKVDMSNLPIAGTPVEMVSVVGYALGNNLAHSMDKYGIIGHRDLLIYRTPTGELRAFSDFKTNDYYSQFDPYPVDENTIERFQTPGLAPGASGQTAVSRLHLNIPQIGDPYRVGLGTLMQASALAYLVDRDVKGIDTYILLEEGRKLWEKFGLTPGANNGMELNKDEVLQKVHMILKNAVKDS